MEVLPPALSCPVFGLTRQEYAPHRVVYIVPVCRYHKINVSSGCFYNTYPNAVRFVETGSTDVPFTNLTGFATIQGERSNLRDDYEKRLFNGKKRYTGLLKKLAVQFPEMKCEAVDPNSDAISSLGAPRNVAQQSSSVAIYCGWEFVFFASGSAWSRGYS